MSDKIGAAHLERRATVYLRQSTLKQVHEHRESTARQYALRQRAVDLGWPEDRVDVVDDDLGQSGTTTEGRSGFQRLAEDVAHGRVGAIFSLEVSRLARSSADWHRLLDLCGLADVVIVDEQAVFTPRDYNDRLLLGLKGTMSEAEQHWMRLRLQGGRLSKARRGEHRITAPIGYEWDEAACRFRLDPDEHVQRAVRLVFERFEIDGTAWGVMRYLQRNGLTLPRRAWATTEIQWSPARAHTILMMLHHPAYAGVYVFGRRESRSTLVDGKVKHRTMLVPRDAWKVCLRDRHPAYISWEQYLANQRKLQANEMRPAWPDKRGAPREGAALLQGLALCGVCGRRMSSIYPGRNHVPQYTCNSGYRTASPDKACFRVPAEHIDAGVTRLFLEAVQPSEIELALAVANETERQGADVDRQWKLRLDRARYEARLAERRYKAVDPDNRVVARTLEREWNEKLGEIDELEREHGAVRRREKIDLLPEDRARIVALATDLPRIWGAATTTHAERKNLVRMLIREVVLSPVEVPQRMSRVKILWHTGAVSDFVVPRPIKWCVAPAEADEIVRTMSGGGASDATVAEELNRRGLLTGKRRAWNAHAVRIVRYRLGLKRRGPWRHVRLGDRDVDGRYTVPGLAAHFGVPKRRVYRWIQLGLLVGERGSGAGNPYRFTLDAATEARLAAARAS